MSNIKKDRYGNIICPDCDGSGGYMCHPTADGSYNDGRPVYEECETCNGKGYVEYMCPFCKEPNDRDVPGNCEMCSHCGPSGM